MLMPAAFRRLCVETYNNGEFNKRGKPAAFRRLCVETKIKPCGFRRRLGPAAFRRLCVETPVLRSTSQEARPAAFRRLCVETIGHLPAAAHTLFQPPSGGCVLKRVRWSMQGEYIHQPPSGGCVLKPRCWTKHWPKTPTSRLQAAVC